MGNFLQQWKYSTSLMPISPCQTRGLGKLTRKGGWEMPAICVPRQQREQVW